MAKETDKAKIRKKKWFQILAPKIFNEQVMGEIFLYEAKSMVKRGITVNMMVLTGNPRNQNINFKFRIIDVKDGKGVTELLGFEMMPSSLKRLARRGRTKIDDSLVIVTSDGKKVRIKPLLVTNSLATRPVVTLLRNIVRENIISLSSRMTFDKLIEEITSYKLQKHLGNAAAKVTPIRESEIRAFVLIEREDVKPTVLRKNKKPEGEEAEALEEDIQESEEQSEKKEGISEAKEEAGQTQEETNNEDSKEAGEEETSKEE